MPAQKYDFEIEQGASFALTWPILENGVPKDLAGYTVRAQIRRSVTSDAVEHEFTSSQGNAVADPRGITITATPVESSVWTWRRGVYDVELIYPNGLDVVRVAEGKVLLRPEVTR